MKSLIVLFGLSLIVAGCTAEDWESPQTYFNHIRQLRHALIESGQIKTGMTSAEFISIWGKDEPDDISQFRRVGYLPTVSMRRQQALLTKEGIGGQ